MKNIFLIISREYLTRVRKKSFIVMTIVGPLLIALMYAGVIWAAVSSLNQKKIGIIDESGMFKNPIGNNKDFLYVNINENINAAKSNLQNGKIDAFVIIPKEVSNKKEKIKIYANKAVSIELQSDIEHNIENEIEQINLKKAGISQNELDEAKIKIKSETISLENNEEKESSGTAATIIGGICGLLVYLSVLIFGTQVMRSVMEEKSNRIVEIIISSVKPFQLLIGKIIGVGLVGLTQFALWIILSAGVMTFGAKIFTSNFSQKHKNEISKMGQDKLPPSAKKALENQDINKTLMPEVFRAIETLPISTILICFVFYFFGGYMFYSALFGAVGSAVDSETDTQQFMLPLTIPIIASFLFAQIVIRDPSSNLAFWLSMVPFSSPIIMMVRLPFGVPIWQLVLSISLLILGFIGTTWLASRIYRVGILMYGKKPTWGEIWKWIFSSN